jgi:uncharacterized protein YecE (DUF72 family)
MRAKSAGIGGWTFEPWRETFYPPKGHPKARELEYASSHVTAIEINGTFYSARSPPPGPIGPSARPTISSSR